MTMTTEPTSQEIVADELEAGQIREDWLTDLRDPGMIKATGQLRNPRTGGMCCLGVLGNVLLENHPEWLKRHGFVVEINPSHRDNGMQIVDTNANIESTTALPVRLARELGLPTDFVGADVPSWADGDGYSTECNIQPGEEVVRELTGGVTASSVSLATLNDSHDKTLPEMADIIEQYI